MKELTVAWSTSIVKGWEIYIIVATESTGKIYYMFNLRITLFLIKAIYLILTLLPQILNLSTYLLDVQIEPSFYLLRKIFFKSMVNIVQNLPNLRKLLKLI